MIPLPWPSRHPTPEPDLANDPAAYYRRAGHRILTHHDNEKHMALEMAQLASEDAARLSEHTDTMSPWEAARDAFSPEETT